MHYSDCNFTDPNFLYSTTFLLGKPKGSNIDSWQKLLVCASFFLWTYFFFLLLLWWQPNRFWDQTAQLDEWHRHTEPHFLTWILIKFILLSVTSLEEKHSQLAQQMMGCLTDTEWEGKHASGAVVLFSHIWKNITFLSLLLFHQNIFLLNRKCECETMSHCSL